MKLQAAVLLAFFAGILAWGSRVSVARQTQTEANQSKSQPQGENTQATHAREPVVVELFTSEGCSSCPPADALLAELDSRQPLHSADIIAIEEHVDYWDQDGWLDPFSSLSWTLRQKEYSDVLRTGGSYTPEMIVDGSAGFVGSRGQMAVQEIEKAAAMNKAKVEIAEASPAQSKSVALKISVEKLSSPNPKDTPQVVLAITEIGLHSAVSAGENSGKELHHSAVLREMKVIGTMGKKGDEAFTAQPTVKLDSKWKLDNLRAVAFVQEKKSLRILGAAEIRLTP